MAFLLLSGGLAGAVGRQFTQSAMQTMTGHSSNPISRRAFESSVKKGGDFANGVTGTVAKGNISYTGSMTGTQAAQALTSYLGQTGIPDAPNYSDVEIGGGRIMGTETSVDYPNGTAFGMYNTEQYISRVCEDRIVQARVIAVAEKVVRVEIFGTECSILARDLSWAWMGGRHRALPCGRTDPCAHPERQAPLPRRHLGKGRCKERKRKLLRHQMLSTAELICCTEKGKHHLKNNNELMECLYHDETTNCDSIVTDCRVSGTRFPVLTAVASLYFKQ